jgi:hypothetical protein
MTLHGPFPLCEQGGIRPGRGVRMRRRSLTVEVILPRVALSRKKIRGQPNLPRGAASSSAPGWDKPRDRIRKWAYLFCPQ